MPDAPRPDGFERRTFSAGTDADRGPAAVQTPSDSLRPGTQLNGIYEIDGLLASGGMGEVYQGHAIQTGHRVAIKVIRSEFADNELVRSLFRNEASSLYHLHHEAIVRYFIFAVDPAISRAYLAMDFVEGEPLKRILRRGPMPVETVARLAIRVAQGLHAAHTHRQGITHRDVSPDNIIIQDGDVGAAMIIDFGIARSTRAGTETIVDSGFAGKYNYVSPEQLGLFGGEVTPKSDIYSLGLVLLAALRGAPADMSGSPAEVIGKRQAVPALDGIDERVQPILARMLQPDPADRPTSMLEILRAFGDLLEPRQASAPPRPLSRAGSERRRLLPKLWGGLAAIIAVTGAGLGVYFLVLPPATKGPAPPQARLEAPRLGPAPGIRPELGPPESTAQPEVSRARRIALYVESYKDGPCFRVRATNIGAASADIEGFGLSPAPFDGLDRAFTQAFGFEAGIKAMLIRPAQCQVLAFLDAASADPRLTPHLELAERLLPAGRQLKGSINIDKARIVALLLVSETGLIRNVTQFLRQGEDVAFDIPIDKPGHSGEPKLLISVATREPLSSLAFAEEPASEELFAKVRAEAKEKRDEIGIGLGYFQVQ
jgi:serine/threonine-protein kinase